jgi:hypothetical protein
MCYSKHTTERERERWLELRDDVNCEIKKKMIGAVAKMY